MFSRSVAQCSCRRVSSLRCSSCTLPNDVAHCKTVSVLALNSHLEKANHSKLLALAPGNHISYLYSSRVALPGGCRKYSSPIVVSRSIASGIASPENNPFLQNRKSFAYERCGFSFLDGFEACCWKKHVEAKALLGSEPVICLWTIICLGP